MSDTDTETDDSDEEYLQQKEKARAPTRRRSTRTRSLAQVLNHNPVARNGDCLYISVLQATKMKGLEPGNTIKTPTELRQVLLNNMDEVINKNANLKQAIVGDIKKEVKQRLTLGMTKKKRGEVPYDAWGGDIEIQIIASMYGLNIVTVDFNNNCIRNAGTITDAKNEIILAYINDEHYDWATIKPSATVEQVNASVTKYFLKF